MKILESIELSVFFMQSMYEQYSPLEGYVKMFFGNLNRRGAGGAERMGITKIKSDFNIEAKGRFLIFWFLVSRNRSTRRTERH